MTRRLIYVLFALLVAGFALAGPPPTNTVAQLLDANTWMPALRNGAAQFDVPMRGY